VQDLLDTAGVAGHDEFTDEFDLDVSPSVVRAGVEDETF
jgi:hypothetical protein